jgi:hypothetical protein
LTTRSAISAMRGTLASDDVLSPRARRHHREQAAAGSDVQNSREWAFPRDDGTDGAFEGIVSVGVVQHPHVPEGDDDRDQPPQLVPRM